MDADIVIIGAGVIGLAVAYKISASGHSVILLEKEHTYGTGISSRNTETIHAGIYYQNGSLKATLCLRGKVLLYEHCKRYQVRHKRIGKLFIAVTKKDIPRLDVTHKQAIENGIDDLVELDKNSLHRIEPELCGEAALLSPSTGVIDSHGFMKSLFVLTESNGVVFAPLSSAIGADHNAGVWKVRIRGDDPAMVSCKVVVNTAGLYAIELSKQVFPTKDTQAFYPTKGSYIRYSGRSPISRIVYPAIVPGLIEERVDASLDIAGSLRFGPNVEKTNGLKDFDVAPDIVDRMAPAIKRYLPGIDTTRLHPDCSGIRPRIYGPNEAPKDFHIQWANEPGWLDLWGIESPGLTASLAIAEHVYGLITNRGIL